jgi:hypothetical protein
MTVSTVKPETPKSALVAGFGVQLLAFAEMLLLAVWLGGMVFFSFAVAPSAFSALPSRHLAGMLVNSTLSKIEIIGLTIGPLLLLVQAALWRARSNEGRGRIIRLSLITLMIACAALSRFWISNALHEIRNRIANIDDVPVTDPMRVQFNDLHQYSVALMGAAMAAGVVVLFLSVRSWLKR